MFCVADEEGDEAGAGLRDERVARVSALPAIPHETRAQSVPVFLHSSLDHPPGYGSDLLAELEKKPDPGEDKGMAGRSRLRERMSVLSVKLLGRLLLALPHFNHAGDIIDVLVQLAQVDTVSVNVLVHARGEMATVGGRQAQWKGHVENGLSRV